jgi:hypothetical protein
VINHKPAIGFLCIAATAVRDYLPSNGLERRSHPMVDRSDENNLAGEAEALSVVITADEARAIDDWSAAHHIDDRSEAVHRLVSLALNAHAEPDDVHLR